MFTEPLDFIYLRNVYWMPTVCQAPRQAPWGIVASFSWQVPSWWGHFVEEWRQMSTGPGEGFWSKDERVPAFREVPSLRAPQGFSFRASLLLAGRGRGSPASPWTVDTSALICALWFLPWSLVWQEVASAVQSIRWQCDHCLLCEFLTTQPTG